MPELKLDVELLVIAASTGGPLALRRILPKLSSTARFPILIVQHMPGQFTAGFAEYLNRVCAIEVREATHQDELRSGVALLAPGGQQMELTRGGRIRIRAARSDETYRPSADVMFASVAQHFHGQVLGIVLTGMGADGQAGAARLKERKAQIWAQDEASSAVYGMPKAVAEAGLADRILSLDDIANFLGAM
ncbi:MAG: CheB methylesterase domain-containing protein [Methylohalobius sp.]|nr:CheB methylesterase domain-containing protein [Methylohalobius sp.]